MYFGHEDSKLQMSRHFLTRDLLLLTQTTQTVKREGWVTDGKVGSQMERLGHKWKGWDTDGKAGTQMERLGHRWVKGSLLLAPCF